MSEPKVYISVLNYNTFEETIACIESLMELAYDNFCIVIVDNASPNGSSIYIQNFLIQSGLDFDSFDDLKFTQSDKKIVFIQSTCNNGYAAGNNIVIKFANLHKYDYIWVLNNDTVVERNTLNNLVKCAQKSKENVGLWGNVLYYYETNMLQGIGGKYNKFIAQARTIGYKKQDHKEICKRKRKVDYPIGASLLFKKEFLESVGMFNETYFLFFEEMDIVQRAKNMGWDFDICCNSILWHKESASVKSIGDGADIVRLKNRIIFTKRYFPCYFPFVVLSFMPVIFNRVKRKKWRVLKGLFK